MERDWIHGYPWLHDIVAHGYWIRQQICCWIHRRNGQVWRDCCATPPALQRVRQRVVDLSWGARHS